MPHKQKDDLECQIHNVEMYMYAKGYPYELIENLCEKFGTDIEIIDATEKTSEQELVEDMIQIVTVFRGRLQGQRANKTKKMIKELLENDKNQED